MFFIVPVGLPRCMVPLKQSGQDILRYSMTGQLGGLQGVVRLMRVSICTANVPTFKSAGVIT